ncbi:PREDICTED: corticosteroid 11-beta-dehydrogenase isozyme 1-like [Amphimedon queenslandica]|uniref:Uncharacterized protein n=1 Tax=Amphimedon queenslandica TaxID=400682 RepID=A0A1X7UST1_AMPQE|nr:PREDICTED: corticosteroid 11-beta-dehydrogenase isozyme 1-like [Amphimedon queenslandica]|eukprot:XP_019852624.1 PREDICTED: corticosteroid 11-beta-dehydrogenase isozyme 1-like [Amphimedon queenslandica]
MFNQAFKFAAKPAIALIIVVSVQFIYNWTYQIDAKEYYQGKGVIITGASKGIGRELAIQAAQLGAKLVIAARTESKLQETALLCQKYTPHVYAVVADVSKEKDCKQIIDIAAHKLERIDIMILNAAFSYPPSWFTQIDQPGDAFLRVFSVNVLQSVFMVQYGLPYLNKSHGSIIAVSSSASQLGMPQVIPYGTSKHGLNGFFKGLRQEFYLTNTPVSITIIPLPYVHTETALKNWKPIGESHGISADVCAQKMLDAIPYRQSWTYIDWSTYIVGHIYSLFPDSIDFIIRKYLPIMSNIF